METCLILGALFIVTERWFRKEVSIGDFFRWSVQEQLVISIDMPPGTDIEKTDELIGKFEKRVLETPCDKTMNVRIFPERADMTIKFPSAVEHSYRPYALKEELIRLATQFAGIGIYIYGFDPQGMYHSSPDILTFYDSRIRFQGYNLKKLKDITSRLEKTLRRNPRVKDVKIISSNGWYYGNTSAFEYVLRIDRKALESHAIDPNYFNYQLLALLPSTFRNQNVSAVLDGKRTDILLSFPDSESRDLRSLQDSLMRTSEGEYLRLSEITKLEELPISGSIDREDQKFQQTIMWEFRGPQKAIENYKKAVFASLDLPPGFTASLDETFRMTGEEKKQIVWAIGMAIIIIFMILAALYESLIQPFIILVALPLSLIGVYLAFIITDFSFDSSAYIGVILMAGVVVNNAILVVDHINLKRRQGKGLSDAIVEGTQERIRPIFMTAITTIVGMVPMIILEAEAGKLNIWSSLALCTVGGLASSTILIPVAVPVLYQFGEKIKPWLFRKFREVQPLKRSQDHDHP